MVTPPVMKELMTKIWSMGSAMTTWSRSNHWKSSIEKGVLKSSQNSQENTSARVSILIKLQALGADVFLGILRMF